MRLNWKLNGKLNVRIRGRLFRGLSLGLRVRLSRRLLRWFSIGLGQIVSGRLNGRLDRRLDRMLSGCQNRLGPGHLAPGVGKLPRKMCIASLGVMLQLLAAEVSSCRCRWMALRETHSSLQDLLQAWGGK